MDNLIPYICDWIDYVPPDLDKGHDGKIQMDDFCERFS